ncbi:hypothetical protein HY212_06645 [Candidatus Pacearchaeota archaeon]|nr:hypothetical protein [Candidatus Pacearchaeota archaeon]
MKKRKKQDIESEITVINSMGVGIGLTMIILALAIYLGLNPLSTAYPLLFVIAAIIIRTLILKRRIR